MSNSFNTTPQPDLFDLNDFTGLFGEEYSHPSSQHGPTLQDDASPLAATNMSELLLSNQPAAGLSSHASLQTVNQDTFQSDYQDPSLIPYLQEDWVYKESDILFPSSNAFNESDYNCFYRSNDDHVGLTFPEQHKSIDIYPTPPSSYPSSLSSAFEYKILSSSSSCQSLVPATTTHKEYHHSLTLGGVKDRNSEQRTLV